MKSMKKVFIGLAAVAAVGSAIYGINLIASESLSNNVDALCGAYCASQPRVDCRLMWLDGDSYTAQGFTKIGSDEVEDYLHQMRKVCDFYDNSH